MPNQPLNLRLIFDRAAELTSDEERRSYLDEVCATAPEVRQKLDALLNANAAAGDFLEPPAHYAATLGTHDLSPLTETPGTAIGPYKLLEQIGEGGFGVVFMAEQQQPIKRRVALKVIKAGMDTRQVIARFEAERQALALMDHPNIAKVLDAGATASGRPFFVMELVRGVPITAYCDEAHLNPRERLGLFVHVCHAVQHAHQKGIIHRDIKPNNVLITLHDGKPVVKVIDFGIAKATGQQLTERTLFTNFAQMVGTPLYMSPEQAGSSALDIDTRSDIYGLGVLLYELLTGSTPFDKERLKSAAFEEVRRIIREEEPPRPSTRLSGCATLASIAALCKTEPRRLSHLFRGEVDWIVMKALEKDRNRRYETANGFAMDVQRYLNNEAVEACPPSAAYRFRKFARRNRAAIAVSGLVLFFLVLLGSGAGWAVRDRAAREAELAGERTERQAKIAGQVQLNLDEIERLSQEQKWPEALAVAKRAEAALVGDEADPATRERVRQALADVEMVARLEEIRLNWGEVGAEGRALDNAGTVRRYAAAFREYGVDVEALPTDQATARLRSRTAIVVPLAAALDDWGQNCQELRDDRLAKVLWTLAWTIDPDRWRQRVRHAIAARDVAGLVALAESPDTAQQPPQSQVMLAVGLRSGGRHAEAIVLLERASETYPASFSIHFELAVLYYSVRPKGLEAALRHGTVARALRPQSSPTWNNLGHGLIEQKKLPEAVACYRKAIELDPKSAMAYSNLGVALAKHGKLDEAIACHRKAVELDPKYAPAYSNLGVALAEQEKLDEAIDCHRKAIELDPKYASAHYELGITLDLQRKLDEAIACYRKAIKLEPRFAFAHYNLGVDLYAQGKLEEAIASHRKAIEFDPKYANAHNGLGTALHDQKKLDEAIACYRKAIELDPKDAGAHTNLGLALHEQKKLDEAIACFRKANELDPGLAAAHYYLGLVLCDQNKLDAASACFRRAIELDPKYAKAHVGLGVAQYGQGNLDEAIACYRKAIELDPKSAKALSNLGIALARQGNLNEAIACYRKAIELDPNYAKAHNGLGVALYGQGKLDEAIACFRKAIELGAELDAHSNLGNALHDQGKLDEAIACYLRAIELDPKFARAYNGLAWLLVICADPKFRDPKRALELARKAVELDPKDASFPNTLGVAHYRAGDWKAAVACLEKSMELRRGGDGSDWFFLAMAHWQLGQKEEARKWYDRAVTWMDKNNPNDEVLRRFREEAAKLLMIEG